MTKLTEQQKAQKKQRDALNELCNRILSAFNFQKIKTWSDIYKFTSIPPNCTNLNSPITYAQCRSYCDELKQQLEIRMSSSPQKVDISKPILVDVSPPIELDPSKIPSIDNDYLLPPTHREHKDLIKYWFQRKAAAEGLHCLLKENKRALQLVASAGYGKTFIAGAIAARLADMNFTDGKSFGATQYLYVTRNTVVEQTKRVFEKMFNLTLKDGFEVINYEQLRAKAGAQWVREKTIIEGGEERIVWEWRKMLNPVVIFWDENQSLKNYGSMQHQIACFFNEIETPTIQIFISATPYMRVSEAKCFAVATRKDITSVVGAETILTNNTWPTYASIMSQNSLPEDYNEAAVERLTKDLEPYIIRVRGVRTQFHAINKVQMISFETDEEKKYYDDTEKRYLEKKAKLQQAIDSGLMTDSGIHHLVLLTQRGISAEYCRYKRFCNVMKQWVDSGYAAACAVKYKTTLIPMVKYFETIGITRDMISLVWGGGNVTLTKKQKDKAKVSNMDEAKLKQLEALGISKEEVLSDLGLDEVEDKVVEELPEHMRLGMQSKEERQREIDRFVSGKTLFCIYTFKAGGVGLSLHHTDELTKEKVRRQKNGYAVLEDISKIPTRPRKTALSVAYSGHDMIQSTARVPRLTSLSDTEQFCMLYNGTVEVDIGHVYSSKLRCHNKVARANESWIDLIIGGDRAKLVADHIKDDVPLQEGEEQESIGEEEE